VIALVEIDLREALILIDLARAMSDLSPVKVSECYSLCGEGIAFLLQFRVGSVVSC